VQTKHANRPLRIKYGIDPTAPDVHLGHTVPLRKMRHFQELGHQAVLIVGDYTAMVGDPSGRDETRKAKQSHEDILEKAQTYVEQLGKILDVSKLEVRFNGEWFAKMSFADVITLTSKITLARIIERDDFQKRLRAGVPISLHECLYSLMQGYDSVMIRADVELGGTEQKYALLVGRDLQRDAGQEPQICMTFPILVGTDGVRRMGKSLGNYIGVNEPPEEMFGKIMSISDDLMWRYYELLSFRPMAEDRFLQPGWEPVLARTPFGAVGLSICYDLRFPELYRHYATRGARFVVLPSQWPRPRLNHFETLLRARAIENQAIVIAVNRIGSEGEHTFFGHSMVIDPWGETICDARDEEILLVCMLDPADLDRVRRDFPVLGDMRHDVWVKEKILAGDKEHA